MADLKMLVQALRDPEFYKGMAGTASGYGKTGLSRLLRGEAMLTGKPIVQGLREQMQADPVQTGMDWINPAAGIAGTIAKISPTIKTIYHGTTPEAAKAIERGGFDLTKSADGTVWFTDNPNIGDVAASGKGAIVKRQFNPEELKLAGWDETDRYSTDELINMGYDGVALPDAGEITYQIFNPKKLKP